MQNASQYGRLFLFSVIWSQTKGIHLLSKKSGTLPYCCYQLWWSNNSILHSYFSFLFYFQGGGNRKNNCIGLKSSGMTFFGYLTDFSCFPLNSLRKSKGIHLLSKKSGTLPYCCYQLWWSNNRTNHLWFSLKKSVSMQFFLSIR
jgi:hypothetical protein